MLRTHIYFTIFFHISGGARVFDARPAMNDQGELVWHHGSIVVNYTFVDSLNEVIEWCGNNQDELVLMSISDCTGDGCNDAVNEALQNANVPYITSCSWFENATLANTRVEAAISNGGQLLAINGDCGYMNYVPAVACSGYNKTSLENKIAKCLEQSETNNLVSSENIELLTQCAEEFRDEYEVLIKQSKLPKVYRCYDDDTTNAFPLGRIFDYLDGVSTSYGTQLQGKMWQMQAIWQETDESVVLGTLVRSSLLEDEERSSLNAKLVASVDAGRWNQISLLEVNNVCDNGPELFTSLRNWWAQQASTRKLKQV